MGMFTNHKIKSLYKKTFKKIKKAYRGFINGIESDTEISVALYVIFDLYAIINKKREQVANATVPLVIQFADWNEQYVKSRVSFYYDFIEKQPRCDYVLGEKEEVKNPVNRIVMALSDVIFNPDLSDNYDTAPIRLFGAIEGIMCMSIVMNVISITNEIDSKLTEILSE